MWGARKLYGYLLIGALVTENLYALLLLTNFISSPHLINETNQG